MKLCIPTLVNYEGLRKLIRSAEAGSVRPSEYVIIDNGGKLGEVNSTEWFGEVLKGSRITKYTVIHPTENLGVAASWNRFLDEGKHEPIVISNDDVVLGEKAFGMLEKLANEGHPRAGFGWALFMQSPECTKKVGYYDENFFPAYYEDVDYMIRMRRVGVPDVRLEGIIDIEHSGFSTTNALGDPDWLRHGRDRNRSYLIAKWGVEHAEHKEYEAPFRGKLPYKGWSGRGYVRTLPLRFDIINGIAERISASRYLELGVADGDSIRRIEIGEKWGVDKGLPPAPEKLGEGVSYFRAKTDDFFASLSPSERFDIVFVDADHHAEQAYRDVKNAIAHLNPGGVVVMHDCSPHTEDMQRPEYSGGAWTGDVWKTIVRLRWEGEHAVATFDTDYGVGIVIPGGNVTHLRRRPRDPAALGYEDLVMHREDLLNLHSGWEWPEWFSRTWPGWRTSKASSTKPPWREEGPVHSWTDDIERGRDELLVVFTKLPYAQTTGVHLLKALEKLLGNRVRYYEPCLRTESGELKCGVDEVTSKDYFPRVRAMLCIDDDHGWCVPRLNVPKYYWCIDSYRMDDPLYLQGTRRERVKLFDKVFYVQKREAEELRGVWLPVGVDREIYRYEPETPKIYDLAFIGRPNTRRDGFIGAMMSRFPNSFSGMASPEDSNRIYNQSRVALNVSAARDINMRMFEGEATSALLITNAIGSGEDELLPYLPRYEGGDTCEAMIEFFLSHPKISAELSRAQAEDMKAHTYEVRARAFLEEIGFR